jgi:hypothetical protein
MKTPADTTLDITGLDLDPEATQGMLDNLGPSDYISAQLESAYEQADITE